MMAGKRNNHGYTDEQVVAEYRRIGSAKGTARSLGVPETSLKRRLDRLGVRSTSRPKGLTMDKILQQHHPVEKFMSVMATLPEGEFHTDIEMQHLCDLSKQAWSRLKRNERARPYKVRLPDSTYVWGRKDDAEELRKKLMEA